MQITGQKITPCLWFDTQAEEAANSYVSIFKSMNRKRVAKVVADALKGADDGELYLEYRQSESFAFPELERVYVLGKGFNCAYGSIHEFGRTDSRTGGGTGRL